MPRVYIVVEAFGEYSNSEWDVVHMSGVRHVAFKDAWCRALSNCDREYHVQEWEMTDDASWQVQTCTIDSTRLRRTYTSSVLHDLQTQLVNSSSTLPETLQAHCTVLRKNAVNFSGGPTSAAAQGLDAAP